jgi:hypothetical protein
MIIDDEYIMIADIQTLSAKGQNMTLAEKVNLDQLYAMLPKTRGVYDPQTKKTNDFTMEQMAFVKHILCPLVRYNVPRLTQVLSVYGFDMGTVFVWEDDQDNETWRR